MGKKIGIIGFGNMGSAIAERIKLKYEVFVFDKDASKAKNLSSIKVALDNIDLVKNSDAVILAMKPQDFNGLLGEIKNYIDDKLVISIAAGITTDYIERALEKVKVVRAMPNIGAKIGKAESCLCKGKNANKTDLVFAQELFSYIGETWNIKESMIDAATAICGSGPAYIFYDLEINNIDSSHIPSKEKQRYIVNLTEAAEDVGFNAKLAKEFAASVTGTSIALVALPGITPTDLKIQVTSKGGTTEAALKVLSTGGTWSQAALAAKKRAEELSRH